MPIMGPNTQDIADNAVQRMLELQQPVLEAAAQVGEFSERMDEVEGIASDVNTRIDEVEPTITIISKRRYDIERFGAIGTADDGATWADAYAQVEAWGGGTIAAPPGEYQFLTGFQSRHGVYAEFTGSGNTHLDFTGLTTPVNGAAIYGSGVLTPLPALGANVALHARTITFASIPALAVGDVFMLYNSNNFSFSPARAEYRAGEYCRVAAITGSTVTLTSPTYAAYTAGVNIQTYRLDGIQTGMSGAKMTFKPGVSGIRTLMGTKLRFDDLDLSGSNLNHVWLDRCYDINLADVRAFDANPIVGSGINYGLLIGNSQRVRVRDNDLETRRHGLTTGGDNIVGCIPNRDIVVTGGRISGLSNGGAAGMGLHGNTEDIHFTGVQFPNGIVPGGKSGSVNDCNIWSDSTGLGIYFTELLSPDWTIEGNYIKATANHDSQFGLIWLGLREFATLPGTLRIANNIIDLGPYGWTDNNGSHAIRIRKLSPTANSNSVLDIDGNTFLTTRTVGANDYAIRQDSTETNYGFNPGYVYNNKNPKNLKIVQDGTIQFPWHFMGAGIGVPTFRARIGSQYTRFDAGGASVLYIATDSAGAWQRATTAT